MIINGERIGGVDGVPVLDLLKDLPAAGTTCPGLTCRGTGDAGTRAAHAGRPSCLLGVRGTIGDKVSSLMGVWLLSETVQTVNAGLDVCFDP